MGSKQLQQRKRFSKVKYNRQSCCDNLQAISTASLPSSSSYSNSTGSVLPVSSSSSSSSILSASSQSTSLSLLPALSSLSSSASFSSPLASLLPNLNQELHGIYQEYKVHDFKSIIASYILAGCFANGYNLFVATVERLSPLLFILFTTLLLHNRNKSSERFMEIKEQAAFMIESLVIASYEFNLLTPLTLKYGLICSLGGLSASAQTVFNDFGICCSRNSSLRVIYEIIDIIKLKQS